MVHSCTVVIGKVVVSLFLSTTCSCFIPLLTSRHCADAAPLADISSEKDREEGKSLEYPRQGRVPHVG
jgi:hypothetical protein